MPSRSLWVESHSDLPKLKETKRFATAIGTPLVTAVGHLHMLWYHAVDARQDGDLSEYSSEEIAAESLYEGDSAVFVAALRGAGFLDENGFLHNWDHYFGRWVRAREAARKRMAALRERQSQASSSANDDDVTAMAVAVTDEQFGVTDESVTRTNGSLRSNPTLPDTTGDNTTPPIVPPKGDRPSRKKTTREPLTDEQRETLVAKWKPVFGESGVRERIAESLNHKAVKNCVVENLYVNGWLRREAQHMPRTFNGGHVPSMRPELVDHTGCPAGCKSMHPERRVTA